MKKQTRENLEEKKGFFSKVNRALTSLSMQKAIVAVAIIFVLAFIVTAGNVIIKNGQIISADNLSVDTNTLFVDSTNNRVGIGTSAPSTDLEVSRSGAKIKLTAGDGGSSYLSFAEGAEVLGFQYEGGANRLYVRDFIAGTNRMAVDYGTGYVGINTGTSAPGNVLEVRGGNDKGIDLRDTSGNLLGFLRKNGGGDDGIFALYDGSGSDLSVALVGGGYSQIRHFGLTVNTSTLSAGNVLEANGNIKANQCMYDKDGVMDGCTSSEKYKDNVSDVAFDKTKLLSLNPVSYTWNDEIPQMTGKRDIGLIAEDVEKQIPELVKHNEDGSPSGLKYDKIALYELELLKDHENEIAFLKSELCKKDSSYAWC
ncbi:MAG: tail fiber domain-containing protein [Nanoarchaeota archaeon]|nr:tail fiber domain-containing protein [Nanoarchaeota archaeon]